MTPSNFSSANEGIQANTVTAEVLAVGRGAKAEKIVNAGERADLLNAVRDLERALNAVNLPKSSREGINGHIAELTNAAQEKQPQAQRVGGILQHITNGLKTAGVAVKEVAELIGPIEKIAGIAHLGLSALGLG